MAIRWKRPIRSGSALSLVLLAVLTAQAWSASSWSRSPDIRPTYRGSYASALVVEAETGRVLLSRNPDLARSPASLTKLMTGLLVLEDIADGRLSLNDTLVVPGEVKQVGGSRVHLWAGEQISIHDALSALFIASGNDAATALACHLEGSEKAFVRRMNERARALGMSQTQFVNPHGLDERGRPGTLTTARDLSLLARELLMHPLTLEISGTMIHTIRGTQVIHNTNKLLGRCRGVDGMKTGYTSKAGFCLVATAKRDGLRIIAVLLGAPDGVNRFSETAGLITRAFTEYQMVPMVRRGQDLGRVLLVRNGSPSHVRLKAGSDLQVLLSAENRHEVRLEVEAPPMVTAPVMVGAPLGMVQVFIADSLAAEGPAVAASHARKAGFLDRLGQRLGIGE